GEVQDIVNGNQLTMLREIEGQAFQFRCPAGGPVVLPQLPGADCIVYFEKSLSIDFEESRIPIRTTKRPHGEGRFGWRAAIRFPNGLDMARGIGVGEIHRLRIDHVQAYGIRDSLAVTIQKRMRAGCGPIAYPHAIRTTSYSVEIIELS